ncbi:hypothetical protein CMU14_13150 [Elizabethkingia anophelis]|nr:hypothetical protein [Elizabethkingia anophelis]
MLGFFKRKRYFSVSVDIREKDNQYTGCFSLQTNGNHFSKNWLYQMIYEEYNVPKGSIVVLSILEFKNKKDFEDFNSNA